MVRPPKTLEDKIRELLRGTPVPITGADEDLPPLRGLRELAQLFLDHNQISDLSPLTVLIDLRYLSLRNNEISDISPLVDNWKSRRHLGRSWGGDDEIDLRGNPLNAEMYS